MLKKKRTWLLITTICLLCFGYITFTHERFGADPSGERLKRIEQSPNYKDNAFHNTMPDPTNLERDSFLVLMYKIHFDKGGKRTPQQDIPSVKTNLKALAAQTPMQDVIVPLGHASFYMQLEGVRILIDPVFTDYAAPFSFLNRSFDGTNVYHLDDMPTIDYIFITHDHYDHLDYEVMKAMRGKVKKVIAPLGVGAHLEHWGYAPENIWEGYWYDSIKINDNLKVQILPARHYSSRLLSRNKTLWGGFGFFTPTRKIFVSGDTGYGDHFQEIAEKVGKFDLVVLDVGQFNPKSWPHIHLLPEDAALAATQLGAKRFLTSHNSKFAIALHDWKDPLDMIEVASKDKDYLLLTPMIGEVIQINDDTQSFGAWWKKLQ